MPNHIGRNQSLKYEPSKNQLPNDVRAFDNQKMLKKFQICYGKPILESFCETKTQSRTHKSRSVSLIHFKSSCVRYLRSIVTKYSTLRSLSSCSVPVISTSKSQKISPPASAFNYTVADSESVSSRVGSKSSRTNSAYSDTGSSYYSTSYSNSPCSKSPCSKSPCSKSPRTKSPASFKSTCSRSRIRRSKSPVSKRSRRSPSRSPIRSCLKSPLTQSRYSKSTVSKNTCLRAVKLTAYSTSSPPRPSCLKHSPSKYHRLRSPVPIKSCLRSNTSKSPDKKQQQLKPPCLKNSSLHPKQSPCKPSCLRSQVTSVSKPKSSNFKSQVPRLSRLDSSQVKSPKILSKSKSPTSKNLPPSTLNKSPQYKSLNPKSVSYKSNYTHQSRSPASIYPPTKSPISSKTPSYKTANSRSIQSNSPQNYSPRSKSPYYGRLVDSIRNHFRSTPPRATVPTLDISRLPVQKSPYSRDSRVIGGNRAYSKPEAKRPKLTVSKIHVKSRLYQGLRYYDGRQKPRTMLGFYDYKRTEQELKYKLSRRHLKKNFNREYLERSLATKMDVRYLTELKNYFERIRGTLTCGAPECPALQERFRKHRIDHHGGQGMNMQPEQYGQDNRQICPQLMKRRNSHNSVYHGANVTGSEAQTKITLANLGGLTISLETRPTSTTNFNQDDPYGAVGPTGANAPNQQSSLNAITNRYKNDIDEELRRWVKKVPTRENTPDDEKHKKIVVQNFIDRINAMDLTKRDRETEFWLRKEIDNFLDDVNLWYPGSNSDREAFKEGLRENLIERLAHQNERFLESIQSVGDNRNNNMINNSTQNVPHNGRYYADDGSQPYGVYGTQSYGNKGTQNYVYSGSQPFGTYGPQNYNKNGIQGYANGGVPSSVPPNFQPNSTQPYRNVYTGNANADNDVPNHNGSQSFGNYKSQNYVNDEAQRYNGLQSNPPLSSTQPYGNLYSTSNNRTNGAQTGAPQGYDKNSANKGPVNIVLDKFGNVVSYGQLGTPSYGFNKALPDSEPSGIRNQSNNNYDTIEPTQSRTLSVHRNDDINRIDNPSILSTGPRNPNKNQNQVVSRPSIRIAEPSNYENSRYAPENVGQPRRLSLKTVSNTNYKNDELTNKEPTSRYEPKSGVRIAQPSNYENSRFAPDDVGQPNDEFANKEPTSRFGQRPMTQQANGLIQPTDDKPPFRNTTYDLSYGHIGENYENRETCENSHPINNSEPISRYTVKSREICICPDPNESVKKQKASCGMREIDLETEIADWLKKCTFIRCNGLMNKHDIIDAIILEIKPYLSQPSYALNKAVLKAKIMNVLRGLGICANTTCAMRNMLLKLANELANRLVGIVSRLECSGVSSWKCSLIKSRPFRYFEQVHVGPNAVNREDLKHDLLQEYEYCVHGTKLENNREILEIISELVIDRIELIRRDADETVRDDIQKVLENTNVLSEEEITNIVNSVMKYTKDICIMITSTNNRTNTTIITRPCLSIRSVYTSEHDVTPNFAAASGSSTPKKKKESSKLSPEENVYTDKIALVVRDWLKTMPDYFENLEDNYMNEIMIQDLAGSIADHAKLGQLISKQMDSQQFITYYIYKWLLKFEIVDDISRADPYVQVLVTKLKEIDVPKMTRPQYGTRQTLKNIQYQETVDDAWDNTFTPKAQDILEDEISIWMNEYPSEVYVNKDKSTQNKLVHEFAKNLQKHKKDDNENISNEIKTWLEKVVKPGDKEMIEVMSKSLRGRIDKLPQDKTIAAVMKQRAEDRRRADEPVSPMQSLQTFSQDESDKTMKEFIIKYVEYNFDEDDPLAKRAYAKLLRHELQRLDPNVLKQVYKGEVFEKISPHKLYRELGYIKDISDWLKTLPIDPNYNRIGNTDRVEFCVNLAKEITTVDEERYQGAMDYDYYVASMIAQFINQLPSKIDKNTNITEYVNSLCVKIFERRTEVPPISPKQVWANIADFLDDYIKLNGQDIANDEIKLEAWAARLLEEIKKMILENPSALPVADVEDRLAQVAKPGDETIKRFNHELDYAKEISDWLKNFPLVNIINEEVIRDLAEKMAECENNVDDNELVLYINQWISKLPLDKSKPIDIPFAIQQLLNRRKKVNEVKANKSLPLDQSVNQKNAGASLNATNSGAKTECRGCCPVDDPGSVIIQVIKEWCNNLPFRGTEEVIKNGKNNIESELYEKLIELNDNPRMTRNNFLYVESLSDKVDELLENIPNNLKLERDKDNLKAELMNKVKQARMFYKDVTLGDEYMKDLEDAVEAVLPNQSSKPDLNPGFEAYKENMAEMFILENFDHGNDADKLKYEQIMKKEVNKFTASAQQRTVIPIQEEKLNNDIISILFDISMPDEKAMVDNVEEIKTKCEIQNWFEKLPLQPINGETELLKRDLKVGLLARKLHILEFEKNPDQKIHKEITKWLTKVPLLAGEDVNIDAFAKELQEILRSTRKSRKCVKASDVDIGKSGIISGSSTDKDAQNSIWVSPTADSENKIQQPPRLKSGDILIDIVEKWSDNIPLPPLPNDQLQMIKGDLRTRLYKKISELNSTKTFDDDQMYNYLMSEEIAQALAALPQSDALIQSQCALKCQLTLAIEGIKPLIREERELQEYKKMVENTVRSTLGSPKNPTPEEKLLLCKIQEEVVNDFIEYKYNNDDEGKLFYKNKMVDALTEYNSIGEEEENRNEIVSDTLVEANKLICELDKIPPPDEPALREEVEELRMKREVDNLFNSVGSEDQVSKIIDRNTLRNSLAKQLHELEKSGQDDKMKAAVNKTLKKLDAESKNEVVKPFLEKLKKNKAIRRPSGYRDSPLRNFMWDNFPRHDSPSLPAQGIQMQVDASVYQPDLVPPKWKLPPQQQPDIMNPDLLVVLPRQSLPPSPGPIGSGLISSNVRHTITQPTQTPPHMSGLTQTSGFSIGAQRIMSPTFPGKFQPVPGLTHPCQIPSQYAPSLASGQGQIDPRSFPGQIQFVPPQSSNARIESEVELIGDECFCDFCQNRCPYFDSDSCDDLFPINPMMYRHPMMPVHPMMPAMSMPYPPMMFPPPAFMYC